jgi:lipopolysaccharide export LptBFGC system permease protein LptF
MCKERSVRSPSSRALPLGRINSIALLRLSDQEQSMAIDFSTVNWLFVAIMAAFAFVASLLGGLISFRNRIGGALLAAILFAAMYVVWNYYPHPQIQLPIVTAYSTPSGG